VAISHPCNKKPVLDHLTSTIASQHLATLDVLDLGIGKGEFGKFIKDNVGIPIRLTGVEAFAKCRSECWSCYDALHIEDIRAFIKRETGTFDVVLLMDVLEHLERPEGPALLNYAIGHARHSVFLSTPISRYPQGALRGNPYQQHISLWTDAELRDLGFRELLRKRVFTYSLRKMFAWIGVYVFDKS